MTGSISVLQGICRIFSLGDREGEFGDEGTGAETVEVEMEGVAFEETSFRVDCVVMGGTHRSVLENGFECLEGPQAGAASFPCDLVVDMDAPFEYEEATGLLLAVSIALFIAAIPAAALGVVALTASETFALARSRASLFVEEVFVGL